LFKKKIINVTEDFLSQRASNIVISKVCQSRGLEERNGIRNPADRVGL